MKIKSYHLGLLLVAAIFGGILITSSFGWWNTESSPEPASFVEGDFAGEYNPSDIRGSYSFAEVSTLFDIPLQTLADAFLLPESINPQNFYNKDLEDLYTAVLGEEQEIGNSAVQLFVAFYKGLPFPLVEDIYLPAKAVEILADTASLTQEEVDYLASHTIQIDKIEGTQSNSEAPTAVQEVAAHDENEAVVKGSTTFYDLIQWGVTEAKIETVINDKMPATGLLVRDYCNQNGLTFSTIKIDMQGLVDAAQ